MEAQKTHRPLRFCDYYSHMTLADFTVFQAECEAGTANPADHGISQGEKA